jgi:hypothetical protein
MRQPPPARGLSGKHLILPLGPDRGVPEGHHAATPMTHRGIVLRRALHPRRRSARRDRAAQNSDGRIGRQATHKSLIVRLGIPIR